MEAVDPDLPVLRPAESLWADTEDPSVPLPPPFPRLSSPNLPLPVFLPLVLISCLFLCIEDASLEDDAVADGGVLGSLAFAETGVDCWLTKLSLGEDTSDGDEAPSALYIEPDTGVGAGIRLDEANELEDPSESCADVIGLTILDDSLADPRLDRLVFVDFFGISRHCSLIPLVSSAGRQG